ncbi:MAG: hypothetical protein OXN95_10090, partial [bacterium]|nr:hypothetical protein [bacterium]
VRWALNNRLLSNVRWALNNRLLSNVRWALNDRLLSNVRWALNDWLAGLQRQPGRYRGSRQPANAHSQHHDIPSIF